MEVLTRVAMGHFLCYWRFTYGLKSPALKTLQKCSFNCISLLRRTNSLHKNEIVRYIYIICTASVWNKTTLKLEKWGHLNVLGQFSTISNKMELREELSNKNCHFLNTTIKSGNFLFESFSWSFILLGIVENWHAKCQGHEKIIEGPPLPRPHHLYLE